MTSVSKQPLMRAQDSPRLLFDLAGIDLAAEVVSRERLEFFNPHRGHMALLDAVVWETPDRTRGVGVKRIRPDEFWTSGHFPGKPMFPGVLMIETAAQLACYLYNARRDHPQLAAFLRIENAAFRSMAVPGDNLYILCEDVKFSLRRFVCDVQGVIDGRIVFEGRIHGMSMGDVKVSDLNHRAGR